MTADHPVTDLMNDHRLIEKVMTALEQRLSETGAFPAEFVEQALDFLVEYADHFHHHKEEESLFPAMAKRGVPVEGGPIGIMLHEHTLGRKLLAGIRENLTSARAGDEQACASISTHAAQYIGLLRNQIWKEDNVLFMMARNVLDAQTAEGASSPCIALRRKLAGRHPPWRSTPLSPIASVRRLSER
ncbi:hypothetical protein EG829_29090 [bacterium]|nr:hypothetical protein [bacterium]